MPNFLAYLRLCRPKQWAKSAFVLIGPAYGLRGLSGRTPSEWIIEAGIAAIAFALASSACYAINDVVDAKSDRLHPRKSKRPVASGAISPTGAICLSVVLMLAAAACILGVAKGSQGLFACLLGVYVLNTTAYSLHIKKIPVMDVMSLAMGFVLRVLGGCAAVGIPPSAWLLNCTFFLSMFLALGKRLGERRTLENDVAALNASRAVQEIYTADLLRMMVVVTAVATLITYSGYVQNLSPMIAAAPSAAAMPSGFTPLWVTMLPATFALLRCLLLLERGTYDDPTELAFRDGPVLLAALVFAGLTLWHVLGIAA